MLGGRPADSPAVIRDRRRASRCGVFTVDSDPPVQRASVSAKDWGNRVVPLVGRGACPGSCTGEKRWTVPLGVGIEGPGTKHEAPGSQAGLPLQG